MNAKRAKRLRRILRAVARSENITIAPDSYVHGGDGAVRLDPMCPRHAYQMVKRRRAV